MKVIKGLHKIYTGINGKSTYGVILRHDNTEEWCKKHGYKYEFTLNVNSLYWEKDEDLLKIGLTSKEIAKIKEIVEEK